MTVYVYPADPYACGHFRMTWPAQHLIAAGHDVRVVEPADRQMPMLIRGDHVTDVRVPDDADVIVFQRVTHRWVAEGIPLIRARGVAVVVDLDDDLGRIHPDNAAFTQLSPRTENTIGPDGNRNMHSWHHLTTACRDATIITVSTPALARRYGHGHARVLHNYLPDHYYGLPRVDHDGVAWPGSIYAHPNDPQAAGNAIARLCQEDPNAFTVVGDPNGTGRAFGLPSDPDGTGAFDLADWPRAVATIGVGIAPLADTRFNESKSFLKPLEMSGTGVPWVGSPRAEYQRLHDMGCGLLADTPRAWHKALTRLRADPSLRAELSEAGRSVAETLRLRDHAWRWAETWADAAAMERGTASGSREATPNRSRSTSRYSSRL